LTQFASRNQRLLVETSKSTASEQHLSNGAVTWAEQLDSRLASVQPTGKISWASANTSLKECKMRIERIRRCSVDIDSEVWGLMGADVGGRSSHKRECFFQKSIPALRQARYESMSDLPRIQKKCRKNSFVVIPPVMRVMSVSHTHSADRGSFESNHATDTGTGTVRQSDWRAYNATKRRC